MSDAFYPAVSTVKAGLACRSPRRGEGRLFDGFLDIAARCEVCGFDLTGPISGDGPAVFVILNLGFVVVALALVTEMTLAPPIWLHMMPWLPLILVGSAGLLRLFKATLFALAYKHGSDVEGDRD